MLWAADDMPSPLVATALHRWHQRWLCAIGDTTTTNAATGEHTAPSWVCGKLVCRDPRSSTNNNQSAPSPANKTQRTTE